MSLELKSGPMLWHKKRFFGSNWRDVQSVLYNDSSFFWFRDITRQNQEGGIFLKDAPGLIAYGKYTLKVPYRPLLPEGYEWKQFLAFGVRSKDVVYWFLCPNQEEVTSWMTAIASTMSPPPKTMPPEQGLSAYKSDTNDYLTRQMPQKQLPQQPPEQGLNASKSYTDVYLTTQMPQKQLPQQPKLCSYPSLNKPMPMSQQAMTTPPYDPQQPSTSQQPSQCTCSQQPSTSQQPSQCTCSQQPSTSQQPSQCTCSQHQVSSYVPRPSPGMSSTSRPPRDSGYNQVQPQPYPAYNIGGTTKQDHMNHKYRPGYSSGDGGGEFATMMLMIGFGQGGGFTRWHGTFWNHYHHHGVLGYDGDDDFDDDGPDILVIGGGDDCDISGGICF